MVKTEKDECGNKSASSKLITQNDILSMEKKTKLCRTKLEKSNEKITKTITQITFI